MSSLAVNPLLHSNIGAKPSIIERTHFSGPSSSSHHTKGGGKRSIALTALTLLSFLFFLNILQNCIQEHLNEMNPQQIVINVTPARLREAQKRKGDIELFNASQKETRTVSSTMEQIPVKLHTNQKAIQP